MENYYKRVSIDSDEPVNFVGVHPLIWHDHPEQPEAGFIECNEKIEALEELCTLRGELIEMYLYPAKATLWKDIPDNIQASIELLTKISELESKLKEV